jgi:hypothetical protein
VEEHRPVAPAGEAESYCILGVRKALRIAAGNLGVVDRSKFLENVGVGQRRSRLSSKSRLKEDEEGGAADKADHDA